MKNVNVEMEVWHRTPSCYIIWPHLWLGMYKVTRIFWYLSLLMFQSAMHIYYTPLTHPILNIALHHYFLVINLCRCLVDLGSPLVPTGLRRYLRRLRCRANGPGDQLEPIGILNLPENSIIWRRKVMVRSYIKYGCVTNIQGRWKHQ